MSLLNLALAYVWHRRLVTAFTVLSVALGVGLILVVLNVRRELQRTFLEQGRTYDLIVGPSGSETALVLSALFHADRPRGNLSYRTYERLADQRGVVAAFPFGLGDRYRDAPIVGTTRAFLEQEAAPGERLFGLAQGRLFEKDLELVAGSAAAARLGLEPGQRFVGSHAGAGAFYEHREFPYTIVGILEPSGTAQDRALFTTLGSYWRIHAANANPQRSGAEAERAHAAGQATDENANREVTVVLLRTVKPLVLQLQQLIPRKFGVMAVRPGEVLTNVFTQVLGPIEKVLLLYGYAVAMVAAASILTTLYLATLARRHDLAVLRALGALPREVFGVVFAEAVILIVFGSGLGVLVSQAATLFLRSDLRTRFGLELSLFAFTPAEVYSLLIVAALGLVAATIPALQAYGSDITGRLGRFS